MNSDNPVSIVTRSTRVQHPEDRVSLWKQRRFVEGVRGDLRGSIQRVLDNNRHWLNPAPSFFRLPELDGLLDFLAIDRERHPITLKSACVFFLTVLGGCVVVVLSFLLVLFLAGITPQ